MLLLAAPAAAGAAPCDTPPQRVIREGIAVDFWMEHAEPAACERPFRSGDDVVFRFRIADTATGTPLTAVYPAAWMDLRPATAASCVGRVKELLSGSIFSAAELDLNVYYVLALNDDATLTVVDPLFGFGNTHLLAQIPLASPGEDWALTRDERTIFVSLPDADLVTAVDTVAWRSETEIAVGPRPSRLALQGDGQYLWVAYGDGSSDGRSGVVAIDVRRRAPAARVVTGRGPHDLALTEDDRFLFVSNRGSGTVSIVDVRGLEEIHEVATGGAPGSLAYSVLSRVAYVAHEQGHVAAVEAESGRMVARIDLEPGLGELEFAPGGRLALAVNPRRDTVSVIDSSNHRLLQTGDLEKGPYQIAFSDELAYVLHRDSEIVLMIPLDTLGAEGAPVAVVDFPCGQRPFGAGALPSLAGAVAQAPGANAVLVANPADRAIYFYREGMAAPMGHFKNFSREPRAVLVVDRSLKQHAPGISETVGRLRRPGVYDVAFFLETPRIVHCFEVTVEPAGGETASGPAVTVAPAPGSRTLVVGTPARIRFRILDRETGAPVTDLTDVRVLAFLAPGIWHERRDATSAGGGSYEVELIPPREGIYYLYVECASRGLALANPHYLVYQAIAPAAG